MTLNANDAREGLDVIDHALDAVRQLFERAPLAEVAIFEDDDPEAVLVETVFKMVDCCLIARQAVAELRRRIDP